MKFFVLALIAMMTAPLIAHAQTHGHDAQPGASAETAGPFAAATAKMHKDMAIGYIDDADIDFVSGMVPHHQGAIDMARIVLRQGTDTLVKRLATDIVLRQEREIAWMKTWLAKPAIALAQMRERHDHGGQPHTPESEAGQAYAEANARMHEDMAVPPTGDVDADFVSAMIPHHQGAIDMARIVLQHGNQSEVKRLAVEIIAAQETEIAWMRDWLSARGN